MLSTGYSTFWPLFALGCLGFAIGCTIFAYREVKKLAVYAGQCTDYMAENNIAALKDSRLGELMSDMAEVRDELASLSASHKRLRSKYGMRDLRERRKGEQDDPNGELDLSTTTDKRALRLELRKKGLLK